MPNLVRDIFAPIKKIVGVTAIDATADSITEPGESITFVCVSGNIWLNTNVVAVANATALLLTAGQSVDFVLKPTQTLSIISDITGGTYQYVVWSL